MAGFYVLSSSEDGISIDGPLDAATLRKRLNDGYWGDRGFYETLPDMDKGCFCERDGQEKLVIILGNIVVPQPVTTVTEWTLP